MKSFRRVSAIFMAIVLVFGLLIGLAGPSLAAGHRVSAGAPTIINGGKSWVYTITTQSLAAAQADTCTTQNIDLSQLAPSRDSNGLPIRQLLVHATFVTSGVDSTIVEWQGSNSETGPWIVIKGFGSIGTAATGAIASKTIGYQVSSNQVYRYNRIAIKNKDATTAGIVKVWAQFTGA